MSRDPVLDELHRIRLQMTREREADPAAYENRLRAANADFPDGVVTFDALWDWIEKRRAELRAAKPKPTGKIGNRPALDSAPITAKTPKGA